MAQGELEMWGLVALLALVAAHCFRCMLEERRRWGDDFNDVGRLAFGTSAVALAGLLLLLVVGFVKFLWLAGVLAHSGCALAGLLAFGVLWWLAKKRRFVRLTLVLVALFIGGAAAYYFFAPSALQAAQAVKGKIDADEQTLGRLDSELRAAMGTGAAPTGLDPETASVEALLAEVKRLRANADKLLADHQQYVDASRSLSDSLTRAPALFRKVAAEFTSNAEAEPYAEIRDDYRDVTATWLALADRAELRAAELKAQEPQFNESLDYLKRTALFLRRLEEALDSYPVSLASGGVREKFLGQYREYVTEYEALRKRLHQFHDDAKAPPAAGNTAGGPK